MDRLELMNLVLVRLHEDLELDDPDATTRPARVLRSAWNNTRDSVLRAHLWNFAVDPAGAQLTADAGYSASELADHTNRFLLPNDFLRLDPQRMRPMLHRREYRVSGDFLYANTAQPILISYVGRVEEVGRWDSMFADAFAWRLAAETTGSIAGGEPSYDSLMGHYRLALAQAKAVDGRENPPEEIEDSDWINARYDGGATERFY